MQSKSVFSGQYLAKSMRSSGYRNTAYALAEIIDNSVEAKAKNIEVLCYQKDNYASKKITKQIEMIAVADDGCGMNEEELWNSLVMGEGTRAEAKGIGKFGMGLPNSSMSQCKTVTVYSWKQPDQVFYTKLDITNIKDQVIVSRPQKIEIPEMWKNRSSFLDGCQTGTLVIWSNIDRLQWKKVETLINNCERNIGRIYRKFIHTNKLKIRLISFDDSTSENNDDRVMRPNDPLYQMVPSSTPAPWDEKSMFIKDGDKLEELFTVDGHDVKIRCTLASKESRKTINGVKAGSQHHGKHANSNLGISVVRANRELYIDTHLCQTYDPLERWWGVEIEFPNELDEIFGVTHNKQDANNFSAMTHTIGAISRNEVDENDANSEGGDLRRLVVRINARIRSMRRTIKNTSPSGDLKDSEGGKKDGDESIPIDPEGGPTQTKNGEEQSLEERQAAITEALVKISSNPEEASKEAKDILDKKLKTVIKIAPLGSYAFFDVSFPGGISMIVLNSDHPTYIRLIKPLEEIPDVTNLEEMKNTVLQLKASLNLLFISWAYYENHVLDEKTSRDIKHVRDNWGKKLSDLMESLEN